MGAGWGLSQPLAKIAVSEGYRHFGLIFWQMVIGAVLLGTFLALRGRGLPLGARQIGFYLLIALIGTIIPNSTSYEAARHLPSGVISVAIATVPMFAFPMALVWGQDRFEWRRLAGLSCGLVGVVLLVSPGAGGNAAGWVAWVPLALIAPLFYGVEGNVVSRFDTGGMNPVQLLCGASVFGALVTLPLAVASGQWIDPRPPWYAPDMALFATSVLHATIYATYVWMVGRAGPVFAGQVAYLITGFGVVWAMVILHETYAGGFWLAVMAMMVGMFLVSPRAKPDANEPLAAPASMGEKEPENNRPQTGARQRP
ncbi:MAG: EamA family transporter [Rhodobacterales bacterium]|nr:MAG: EamA family transporter [Rhodobacterales bacterium]